jgi:hypothetical protein
VWKSIQTYNLWLEAADSEKVIADFLFYSVQAPDMAGGLRILVQITYMLDSIMFIN